MNCKPDMPDIITEVAKYRREKPWTGGGNETVCGAGSTMGATVKQRAFIERIVREYDIESIADLGAGDLNWVRRTDLNGAIYTPYDLVPRHKFVIEHDMLRDEIPRVDLLMVVWVLNHFPHDHARHALDRILVSGSDYLLMTWEPRVPDFLDLPHIESVVIRDRGKGDPRGNVEIRLHKISDLC